jgi:hypothetical protein
MASSLLLETPFPTPEGKALLTIPSALVYELEGTAGNVSMGDTKGSYLSAAFVSI